MHKNDDELLKSWQMIYNLSLQMLHNRDDAADATQAIFEKAFTHIESFRGESKISTWLYRIAHNYLVDIKRQTFKEPISFKLFEHDVNNFVPYNQEFGLTPEEEKIYAYEVKVGCTLALLQCLEPHDRIVFVLGNIFEFPSALSAEVCGISAENFRKKLSRIRKKVGNFLSDNCGLINPNATCHCRKRLLVAHNRNRIDLKKSIFQSDVPIIAEYIDQVHTVESVAHIFQENPFYLETYEVYGAIEALSALFQKEQVDAV